MRILLFLRFHPSSFEQEFQTRDMSKWSESLCSKHGYSE